MNHGPSYLSSNIHDFIGVDFWNLLKRFKARKFAHSAQILLQVKSHEPFPSFLTGYRGLRWGTAQFPKRAKAPSCVVLCTVQRLPMLLKGSVNSHLSLAWALLVCLNSHVELKAAFIQILAWKNTVHHTWLL